MSRPLAIDLYCGLPMVVENVRGAQKYVGRAAWNYGSYYLWGDLPALMPAPVDARKGPRVPIRWVWPQLPDRFGE